MHTTVGTAYYISPEVLSGNYDSLCDLWSAGCILYILLVGYPPFYHEDEFEILKMVQRGSFDFEGEEWQTISKEAKDLIKKLITRPEKRLTAQEALEHPWFKKFEPKRISQFMKKRNFKALKSYGKTQNL